MMERRLRRGLGAAGLVWLAALMACGDASTGADLPPLGAGATPGSSSGDAGDATTADGATSASSGGGSSGAGGSSGSPVGTPDAGSSSTGSDTTGCGYGPHATGLQRFVSATGMPFHTYAPASYDPEVAHRVVVVLHSQDSNGVGEFEAFWRALADEKQLVVLVPQGSGASTDPGTWPEGRNWRTADLNGVLDLVDAVDRCYNVDTKRRLLWGFSAGGHYGYLLGTGAAEVFAGLAFGGANAGFARQNGYGPGKASWPIPISHVHGVGDGNPIALTRQDKQAFENAGHVFALHEHPGGHSITAAQVRQQLADLEASTAP